MTIDRNKLRQTSFQPATETTHRRLIVSVTGHDKSGKTDFALSAPGPIAIQSLDIGTEGVVDKWLNGERGAKEIYLSEYTADGTQKATEKEWSRFASDFKQALGLGVRTINWDTATEVWEMLRMAEFGKLTQVMPHNYAPVNAMFRRLLRTVYDSDVNLILLHKVKKEYRESPKSKEGKANWTGKYERAGFSDIGFLAQCNVFCYREVNEDGSAGDFALRIENCRQNPDIVGMEIPNDFAMLAGLVFPDVDPSEWE